MRLFIAAVGVVALAAAARVSPAQEKKGVVVELAGMKAATPTDWKEEAIKPGSMRMHTFKLPKAEGDPEDAELALFTFPGGAGTVEQNLKRQEAKFEPPAGKKIEDVTRVEKAKVGNLDATYQDIHGTLLRKFPPFDPNAKVTKVPDYRQLYVLFETKDGRQYYMTLLGPAKTVEKHKKAFDEWVKSFK
jgi:hypothetical protein